MKQRKVLSYTELRHIVKKFRIQIGNVKILENGLLEINGGFKMCHTNLTKLPLRFASVTGDFVVRSNRLTTLKGCPTVVGGDFDCRNNDLPSLKFSPITVGRNFYCQENNLTSLLGVPEVIPNLFCCGINSLQTLEHSPTTVGGDYIASHNQITSLVGLPRSVGGCLAVSANPLVNLVGCPEHIGNVFSFDYTVRSLYMGNQNCEVPTVRIEKLRNFTNTIQQSLDLSIIRQSKHLSILFKYNKYLGIWNENGTINEGNLDDILYDINDGLL
jgi:hypothetical protein